MKYLILILLLVSGTAQAQMSCVGLFEVARLLSEKEIEEFIFEYHSLRWQLLNSVDSYGIIRREYNAKGLELKKILSDGEIARRMRLVQHSNSKSKPGHVENLHINMNSLVAENYARERGMTLNGTDFMGNHIIHHAAYEGRRDIIEALLSLGVDINLKGGSNQTPLDAAVLRYNRENDVENTLDIIESLRDRGAINSEEFLKRKDVVVPLTRSQQAAHTSFFASLSKTMTPNKMYIQVNLNDFKADSEMIDHSITKKEVHDAIESAREVLQIPQKKSAVERLFNIFKKNSKGEREGM